LYLAEPAARYATQLLVELTGGRWTGEAEVRAELPAPPAIRFRPQRAGEVIGLELEEAEQRERLGRLGFDVAPDWTVTTPTWRTPTCRPGRRFPRSAGGSAGSSRAISSSRRARSRRCSRRCTSSRASSARRCGRGRPSARPCSPAGSRRTAPPRSTARGAR